jgi:hypothetical protein
MSNDTHEEIQQPNDGQTQFARATLNARREWNFKVPNANDGPFAPTRGNLQEYSSPGLRASIIAPANCF